jgi:hypothetical protein
MEYKGNIEWKLTKSQVESEMGKQITDEEFEYFAKHFKNYFEAQFETTLESQVLDWDEVKTWSFRD